MSEPVFCTLLFQWPCMTLANWAAWVQAVGSVLAILAAVEIFRRQSNLARSLTAVQGEHMANLEQAKIDREDAERSRVRGVSMTRFLHGLFDLNFEAQVAEDSMRNLPRPEPDASTEELQEWRKHSLDAMVLCELHTSITDADIAEFASYLPEHAVSEAARLTMNVKDYRSECRVITHMLQLQVVLPQTIEESMDNAATVLADVQQSCESLREVIAPNSPPFKAD